MAEYSDSAMLDFLWKALFNRARTSPYKQYFEENIPTAVDLHAGEIPASPIPETPPENSTQEIKKWYGGERIIMTQDRSVSGGRAWVALSQWQPNWSSGSGDVSQIRRNFISPKYGKGYVVRVYRGDGTPIPELSDLSWVFDYKAGVLTFEKDPGLSGTSPETSVHIEVYQYRGKFVTEMFGDTPPPTVIESTSLAPKGLSVNSHGEQVYVYFSYEDSPEISHFVLERWDPDRGRWVPYDGAAGVITK